MKTFPLFTAFALAGLGWLSVSRADESAPRSDLTGQIVNPAGAPAPDVIVMIVAAGPRAGNSPLCLRNYPDCGKKTVSDAQGRFRLASLDPTLDFYIAALVPGCEPFFRSKLLAGAEPTVVKLRAQDLSAVPPQRHVYGRIIGPDGAPAAGVMIDIKGVDRKDGTMWGGNDVTESMVLSDASGEFHLTGRKDFVALQAIVTPPGLASRWAKLEPGKALLLRVKPGASMRGCLILDGQPLRGVTLGIATETRTCGEYFNGYQAVTDEEGRFVFQNVPAGLKFQIFGLMDSFKSRKAAFRSVFVSAADGASADLGELSAKPACRLTGRVTLADGKPLPPQTRLMIDRAAAWDTTLAPLNAEGNFEVDGLPQGEQIGLHLNIEGYRFSGKNPNLDPGSQAALVGKVTGDIAGLNILLEPGKRPNWNDIDHPSYEDQQKAAQIPLRGVP
jgi:hypothetical protein